MINLKQIEAFRAVMTYRTVTHAAKSMHISQPAASRLISDLEYNVGFSLFQRDKGRLVPTPEAMAFFDDVEKVFTGLEKVAESAREIKEFRTGKLFVAGMPAITTFLLPEAVKEFSEINEGVTITLQAHSSQRVLDWMATQQCDIGFIGLNIEDPSVDVVHLKSSRMKVVMPADHWMASKDYIDIEDFEGENFVSFGQNQDSRPFIDQVFHDKGVKRKIRLDTQLSSVACEMVMYGGGVSIVDPLTAKTYSSRGLIAKPLSEVIEFHYSAVLPSYRPPSRLAKNFLELVDSMLDNKLE
ncbi:LysR substrate-binding domain-containing protein [Aidingimonas lacisalsi]|uniref:LysR substrate-binding domain-containing protein n=1 Tax=Aidingimonas lacisalsi TaxID=2604086 RepID=UPI0011D1C62E|nr:LysR substrate-binding domain-containing protein [Aidingimonas lacisalsi]